MIIFVILLILKEVWTLSCDKYFQKNYPASGNCWSLSARDNLVYYAFDNQGLYIYNVTNPYEEDLVGSLVIPGTRKLYIQGDYAYVAALANGLKIVDISDPTSPVLKSTFSNSTSHDSWDVSVYGDLAYMTDSTPHILYIINVSNVTSPYLVSTFDTTAFSEAVDVMGDYVYTSVTGGLGIIDISDPENPFLESTCSAVDSGKVVAVNGNYAYFSSYNDGFATCDISVPSSPSFLGYFDSVTGWTYDVVFSGNLAYIANYEDGLRIVDISNAISPVLVETLDYGSSMSVDVDGTMLYMGHYNVGGFVVSECLPDPPPDDDYFTLIKGTSTESNLNAVYECGTPTSAISSRRESTGFWFANQRIYFFGGYGIGNYSQIGHLNDVWTFSTGDSDNEWCFVKGNKSVDQQSSSYSALNVFSDENDISARSSFGSFSSDSAFFVFGGETFNFSQTNDLWEFDVVKRYWRILLEEDNSEEDQLHQPSKRSGSCFAQDFQENKVFSFGGKYEDEYFNDLWSYHISTNEFTRLRNKSTDDVFPSNDYYYVDEHYTLNEQNNASLNPPRRSKCICWFDKTSDFFIFGGEFSNTFPTNDLWMLNNTHLYWVFLKGGGGEVESVVDATYQFSGNNIPSVRSGMIFFTNQVKYNSENSIMFFGGANLPLGSAYGGLWVFSNSLTEFKFSNGSLVENSLGDDDLIGSRYLGVGSTKVSMKFFIFGGTSLEGD